MGGLLADEDGAHRRLHVVVDAAPAGALEEREGAIMSVEHHLLALTRIGSHEHHARVAEPDMSDFDGHRHAVEQDDFVAPVELIGLAGRKAQWYEDGGCRGGLLLAPTSGIAAYGVIAALIAKTP